MASDPWWFSGSDQLGEEPEPSASAGGTDWLSMLSGAQRMVSWATEAIIAPHAEHSDPAEHPQCLLCRGSLILGDSGLSGLWSLAGLLSGHDAGEEAGSEPDGGARFDERGFESSEPIEPIRWIPVRDEVP